MQRLAFERLDRIEGRRGPDRPEIVAFTPPPGMIKAEAGFLEEMRTGSLSSKLMATTRLVVCGCGLVNFMARNELTARVSRWRLRARSRGRNRLGWGCPDALAWRVLLPCETK